MSIWPVKQEVQLMLTNPRNVFRGQTRSPNIAPFHTITLGIVSSYAIVTVFKIFDFKKMSLKKSDKCQKEVTQGH